MQDHALIGRKEIAEFLRIELKWLVAMNTYIPGGVPHALIGKTWVATTHTIMQWLTDLVNARAVIVYNLPSKKWRPSEEVLAKFGPNAVMRAARRATEVKTEEKVAVVLQRSRQLPAPQQPHQ
jgi:hypothetical protein